VRRTFLSALATAALLPIALVTTTASASTTSGTLTVTTYDRTGAKVAAKLYLVDVATNQQYTATGNKAKSLHKGTYAVVTDIWTAGNQTDTLGARVIKVSGKTTTTIDARSGKALRVTLSKTPGQEYQPELRAQICAAPDSVTEVGAWNVPGKLFVIPNSSKHLQFAYAASWQNSTTNDAYVVAGSTKSTVPTGLSHTYQTASLATVTGALKSGPSAGDSAELRLTERTACKAGYGSLFYSGPMPATATVHASPGSWDLEADWTAVQKNGETAFIGFLPRTVKLAAGKSYHQSFFTSAWGPARNLPTVGAAKIGFDTSSMFTDPGAGTWGGEGSQRSKVTLYDAKHKVIKSQWRSDWADGEPWFSATAKANGWYTLQVNAQRYRPEQSYPATLLSTKADAVFHLKADPKAAERVADVIMPRLVPSGLTMSNSAQPGTNTVVVIRPDRHNPDNGLKFGSVKAKTATLLASFDSGKTWHAMPVKKVGGNWQATVKNAGQTGYVYLRSRLTATNGQWVEVTDYRAYRLG